MIRINLLPEAKRAAASGGNSQVWAVVYLLSAVAASVVLGLVWLSYSAVLEEQQAKNEELQSQIERAKKQTDNIGEIEGKLAKSKQLEEVVSSLQSARSGPARMLMELSKILSEGGGPTVASEEIESLRRDNPMLVYNPGWDVRRLTLESFEEIARKCRISGFGKTNEDVAEFLRRLNISEVFDNVTLQSTQASIDDATKLPTVEFTLTCEVKY